MEHRVRFCWHCGRALQPGSFEIIQVDHHARTLHKQCAEQIKDDHVERRDGYHTDEQVDCHRDLRWLSDPPEDE